MTAPARIALVGAGTMGANHARLLRDHSRARLHVVIDHDLDRAVQLADKAGCRGSSDLEAALACDAVIVATPTETHVDIALPLLEAGKPLLVEKPLALDPGDVRRLLDMSDTKDVPIMCGFVERFNPVIATALTLLDEAPLHILAVRHSPHAPRIASSVVFDLLIHDIDLAFRFASNTDIAELHGLSWAPPENKVAEIADCAMKFAAGTVVTLSASRASQRKIRLFSIATSSFLLELDLLRADMTVYRHVSQEQLAEGATTYRAETIVDIPFVRHAGEPLALQLGHFLDLVDGRSDIDTERSGLIAPHEVAAKIEKASGP